MAIKIQLHTSRRQGFSPAIQMNITGMDSIEHGHARDIYERLIENRFVLYQKGSDPDAPGYNPGSRKGPLKRLVGPLTSGSELTALVDYLLSHGAEFENIDQVRRDIVRCSQELVELRTQYGHSPNTAKAAFTLIAAARIPDKLYATLTLPLGENDTTIGFVKNICTNVLGDPRAALPVKDKKSGTLTLRLELNGREEAEKIFDALSGAYSFPDEKQIRETIRTGTIAVPGEAVRR